jgi:hypothetical protein
MICADEVSHDCVLCVVVVQSWGTDYNSASGPGVNVGAVEGKLKFVYTYACPIMKVVSCKNHFPPFNIQFVRTVQYVMYTNRWNWAIKALVHSGILWVLVKRKEGRRGLVFKVSDSWSEYRGFNTGAVAPWESHITLIASESSFESKRPHTGGNCVTCCWPLSPV